MKNKKLVLRLGMLIGLIGIAAMFASCPDRVITDKPAEKPDMSNSDIQAVEAAKAKLKIAYAEGDNKENVTQDITLPKEIDGIAISWTSDKPAVIAADGKVTRTAEDVTVTLTAELKKNSATAKKVFTVNVVKKPDMSNPDIQAVEAAKAKLEIVYAEGDNENRVTKNMSLPANIDGIAISWTSDNPAAVTADGKVTRGSEDVTVTLTAELKKNSATAKKVFTVNVVKKPDMSNPDIQAVEAAKAKLEIVYAEGDNENRVTKNMSLPVNIDGIAISWTSDKPAVIAADGKVTRGSEDVTVTLTAELKKNSATAKKVFTVNVVKKPDMSDPDVQAVEAAKAKLMLVKDQLKIVYAEGDNENHVTQNIPLPVNIDGIAISWTSDKPAVIAADGKVIRQDLDTKVTLTAVMTKNAVTEKKSFELTVIGTADEWVNEALEQASVSPLVIQKSQNQITLSGGGITWSSNNTSVLNLVNEPSGICTVIKPNAKTEITVTAKAEKTGISKSKDFTIVVYPDSLEANAEELLAALRIESEAETDFELPHTIAGAEGSSISWTSDKPSVISINSGTPTTAKITQDLRDITVNLTASLTYKTETKQKTFPVTVKHFREIEIHPTQGGPQIEIYNFREDGFTCIQYFWLAGKRSHQYSYTDTGTPDGNRFAIRQTHEWFEGKYYEIGTPEHEAQWDKYNEKNVSWQFRAWGILIEKPLLALSDVKNIDPFAESEEDSLDTLRRHGKPDLPAYEEFKKLAPERQSDLLKEAINGFRKKTATEYCGLPETASWDDIADFFLHKWKEEDFKSLVEQSKNPVDCTYTLTKDAAGKVNIDIQTDPKTLPWFSGYWKH